MVNNVYYSVISLITVSLIGGGIQGYPQGRLVGQRWYNYPGPEVNVSVDQKHRTESPGLPGVPDVNFRHQIDPDDAIIFPSELSDVESKDNFEPQAAECKSTFCENPPNYPTDFIKNAIKLRGDLKHLAIIDEISEVGQRVDVDDDEPLCLYEDKVIFPKAASSRDNEWLYVVNEKDFPQGVRVEQCVANENEGCLLVDNFAEGYTTTCKQKYVYRQLVSVSKNGIVDTNFFRFPASCCCHVKFHGNAATRFGNFASGSRGNLQSRLNKHRPKT